MHFLIGCLKHAFYRFGIICFPALPHHSPAFTLISNAFLFISTAFALHSPAFPWQSPCIHLYVPCIPSYLFHPAPRISLVETCIPLHSIQSLSFPQQTQFFNPTGSPMRRDAPRTGNFPHSVTRHGRGGGANCATQPYSKNAPQEGFNFKPSFDFPFGLENMLQFPQTPIPR